MKAGYWKRAAAVTALVTTVGAGLGTPAASAHSAATRAALGACWATNLGFGVGEDISASDFVARWRAGPIQTIIQGPVPQGRSWTLSLYHAHRGRMLSYYDHQISTNGSTFSVTIGGPRAQAKGMYIDPTANGGDSTGYLFLRVYKASGKVTPPTVTYSGALPSVLTSCSSMRSDLLSTLQKADQASPLSKCTNSTVGACKVSLWPKGTSPFKLWSSAVDPSKSVPPNNVTAVPLLTQLADPNVIFHAVFFNMSNGDMVLHGTLPPAVISAQAPHTGIRYLSLCAYPKNQSAKPLSCLDDKTLSVDAQGHYVVVVSPDQQAPGTNWLSSGSVTVGAVIMRWLLPNGGYKANFCLPSILTDRQSGDTTLPALPPGC